MSQQNIFPTLLSIFEKRTNLSNGNFKSMIWQGDWQNEKLFFVDGALWNENVFTPAIQNGKIILNTNEYMY